MKEEHGINKRKTPQLLHYSPSNELVVCYNDIPQRLFISNIEESDALHPSVSYITV